MCLHHHSLNHYFKVDDSRLHSNALPENIDILLKTTSGSYLDIKDWMAQNKLQRKCKKDRNDARQNKTKNIPHFRKHASVWRYHSPTPWFCQYPWKTSLVKPPNPATTSFAELVLSGSIFLPRSVIPVTSLILLRLDSYSSLLSGPCFLCSQSSAHSELCARHILKNM